MNKSTHQNHFINSLVKIQHVPTINYTIEMTQKSKQHFFILYLFVFFQSLRSVIAIKHFNVSDSLF